VKAHVSPSTPDESRVSLTVAELNSYMADLVSLGAQRYSAVQILRLADSAKASTSDLARIVEADPVLSLRVVQLANSASYGLGGTVTSVGRAVALLGFSTVRALAASALLAMPDDAEDTRFESGYWSHSLATAIAASVIARRTSVPAGDAFTVGLLHDLGSAVLFRRFAAGYTSVRELAGTSATRQLDNEHRAFGVNHCELGAALLEHMRFPVPIVNAIRQHHSASTTVRGGLGVVTQAGMALADLFESSTHFDAAGDLEGLLGILGLARVAVSDLQADLAHEASELSHALVPTAAGDSVGRAS
jgi:putative nucleotidyltransferase with HDIG domain